jgi:phosphoenolpyruvate carboxylase
MGQPPGTLNGRLRVTEQGEVAFARYANRSIAHRHLEQTINAVLRASLHTEDSGRRAPKRRWLATMDTLSPVAMQAYRSLVYDDPEFVRYFRGATPIEQISELYIGSRPAKRKRSDRIEDLRAIPWVFSWTQNRHGLPGWYGMGTALQSHMEKQPGGRALLAEMYEQWPFFRSLVDNAQHSLGRADLAVSRLYANLVEQAGIRGRVFGAVESEWLRTEQAILDVTGLENILEHSPVLARSIRLRNPYVDPLSLVQVSFLGRLRQMDEASSGRDAALRLVALSINGVAAGLQSTG